MSLHSFFSWLKQRFGAYEPAVILIFFTMAGAALIFLQLTSEMLEGETRGFDSAILQALRQPDDPGIPIGPVWLTKSLSDMTSLGGTTVLCLVTLLAISYLLIIRRPFTGLFVSFCVVGGWLVSSGLKLGVARPRPDIVAHLVEVNDFSFPSGHAMLSAVTYLTLGALLSRTQTTHAARYYFIVVALLLTLLIGISRVYLGVHYPTDVLGGWTAGAAWACGCLLLARRLLPAGELPSRTVERRDRPGIDE